MEASTQQFKVGIHIPEVVNAADEKVCELYFTDAIYDKVNYWTGETQSMLAETIKTVNEAKPTKIIQYIDSWGGSAPVGFGIYNYLKQHSAKVEVKILNNVASIATVMMCAGNKGKIGMPRNGMMVIHQAMNSAQGTAAELREAADVCDKYTENVLDVYVQNNRKGKTRDELYACIKDGDYWMTGTEALEMGFIDYVYNDEAITITNSIEKAKMVYNNIPQRILDMAEQTTPEESEEPAIEPKHTNFFTKLFNDLHMKIDSVVAKFKSDLPNNGIVGEGAQAINLVALLEAPITNMLTSIQESITAEINTASENALTSLTEGVTAAEAKYKDIIDGFSGQVGELVNKVSELSEKVTAQAETITAQAKTITNLTADVATAAGRPAPAKGDESDSATVGNNANKKPKLTFVGRTTPVNVSD